MKKQNPYQQLKTPTRWICIGCHSQFSGDKTCPFCQCAVYSIGINKNKNRKNRTFL
ncbi:putative zinc ribbon protein [Klebsiella michiganensis]|uniref:putative zinc ribbon protein n=1 Tax=Klebsiella michiganensis TaxID=1134687 RepID=UPI003D073C67